MFKLLIECTKDISEISINFTDGTSVVKSSESETPETPESKPDKKPKPNVPKPKEPNFSDARRELLDLADWDSSNTSVSNVKPSQVIKPEIANHDRQVKVATELQNLDI